MQLGLGFNSGFTRPHGIKGEELPALTCFVDANGIDCITGKPRDGVRPKIARRDVGLHDANLPASWKAAPYLMRDVGTDSALPVGAEDEELGHVPDGFIGGDAGLFLYQNQAGQFAGDPDQKGIPVRLGPIKRKMRVVEFAVRSYVQVEKLTEVVHIQLKQIREDGLLLPCGGD